MQIFKSASTYCRTLIYITCKHKTSIYHSHFIWPFFVRVHRDQEQLKHFVVLHDFITLIRFHIRLCVTFHKLKGNDNNNDDNEGNYLEARAGI